MDNDKQMEFLFEEGGIADDGMERDPVSGNEVPAGSLAKEVRDDIPAQLSEGEYVVPADVVRYYGVKFFEDLREDAKEGLGDMEEDGRIGGEPVDMEDDDMELSPEEQAELDSIMGMAVGGMVQNSYDNPPPQAIGNTMIEPRGYQEGGTVMPFDLSKYRGGFSFLGQQPGSPGIQAVGSATNVTLYGPNGEVVNFILPLQQSDYDAKINEGWSTSPITQQAVQVQTPVVQTMTQQDSGDDFRQISERDMERTISQASTGQGAFTTDELGRVQSDPIGYANEMLSEETLSPAIGLALPGLMGPIGGTMLSGAALDNIAKARAARQYAAQSGNYSDEQLAEIDNKIAAALEDAPFSVRFLDSLGFGKGTRYAEDIATGTSRLAASARSTRPSWMEEVRNPQGISATEASMNYVRGLTGSARDYAEQQVRSGYTGTTVGGVAIGKISGEDGNIEGVVVGSYDANGNPIAAKLGDKTVYRDAQGRTYVRDGFFGQRTRYVDVEGIEQSPEAERQQQPTQQDSGSDRGDFGGGDYRGPQDGETNTGDWFGDRDGDGVKNWRDFNDGVGANDKNKDGGGSSEGSGKIVCTAMNASYGFGSYRQAIWLRYSEKHLTGYHEKGYHKIFLPLVDRAYNRGDKNSKLLRKVLENIARHRTADLRAEMQGKKRDTVGRIYRAVLEPLCYIVGRLSKK